MSLDCPNFGGVEPAPENVLNSETYFPSGVGDTQVLSRQVPNAQTPLLMKRTLYPWPQWAGGIFDWARPFNLGFLTLPELIISGPNANDAAAGAPYSEILPIRKSTFPPQSPGT